MDLFGKFRKLDSSLQRGLDNGFARVFGGEVVPAEIDETLKQQVETSVMMDPDGNRWAPCHFVVNISQRDFDSLHQNHSGVEEDLSDRLQRFIRNSGWRTNSPVQVIIRPLEGMHSGQLKADSMFNAPPPSSDSSDFSDASSERSNASFHGAGYDSDDSEFEDSAADFGEEFDASARNQNSYDSLKAAHEEAEANSGEFASQNPAQNAAQSSVEDSAPGLSDIVKPAPSSQYVWDNASGAAAGAGAAATGAAASSQSVTQSTPEGSEELASKENNNAHPGESAYATDRIAQSSEYAAQPPVSYPGTEALAHNVHREDPRTGASGERNQNQAQVTLILRDGSDRRHVLRDGSNVIGRGNGVDLRIPDTGVSRQHAEITWDGYDAVLTDLQSTNGTSVNDTPIENWLLADGDIIVMGHSEIEVQFH